MARNFPFSAVSGQDDFKLALLINAVDPMIGGVLAAGERGSAKSTLARALGDLLPGGRFVELPLGATLDRVVGSVDTGRLLAGGELTARPGLLAQADGGVLYVDEVNLLGDHLVDVLLDAAAFGCVRVERDGISEEHASRFVLVGTMNPEEGELRPQLLDRFGLSAAIAAPREPAARAAIARQRIEFERDPARFVERHSNEEARLTSAIARGRELLAAVELPDGLVDEISRACAELGVIGMRADIVTCRAATAIAALAGRDRVGRADVLAAARLALAHRAPGGASEPRRFDATEIAMAFGEAPRADSSPRIAEPSSATTTSSGPPARTTAGRQASRCDEAGPEGAGSDDTGSGDRAPVARPAPPALPKAGSIRAGRGERAAAGERPPLDTRPAAGEESLDMLATARAAVTRRLLAGEEGTGVEPQDLRSPIRGGREARLVLCVIDASSSVLDDGSRHDLRMLLAAMVTDATRRRDRIGLIVFRGREARLAAPPSRNHAAVLAGLDTVEPGGTTPLAEGLRLAHATAARELRRNPELAPVVALVTDGYGNVGRSSDAQREAVDEARRLVSAGVRLVVIGDPASGARDFARTGGGSFQPFASGAGGDGRRVA